MALTRKFLSALGIEEEKAEQIIAAHSETVDGLKTERDNYKADAEKLPGVQAELDDLKAAAAKNEKDPYKVKYEAMKEDFDKFKSDIEAKETAAKKEAAYKQLLKDAGVPERRFDAILRVTDLNDFELDAEGNPKEAAKFADAIKTEWADFIPVKSTAGANVPTPPASAPGAVKTKKEIMEITDTAERQKAWAEFISSQKGT